MDIVKAPFPYFGSKAKVANIIWKAFGSISNYIEPFAGSLAVLLANPNIPKIETITDTDHFLCNFWRSISQNRKEVIEYANYPVIENDLHLRHKYLVSQSNELKEKISSDYEYCDPKMAGYWIWGISCSIGDNWLKSKGLKSTPILSSAGGGINGLTFNIEKEFELLEKRLKRVRVCCGDWQRIITPSITYKNKSLTNKDTTAVFLDPPYSMNNRNKVYREDGDIYNDVCKWAIENSNIEKMKIAVCGYDGDFEFPDTWKTYKWKTNGGMANLGNDRGKENANREIIYFSPNCLNPNE